MSGEDKAFFEQMATQRDNYRVLAECLDDVVGKQRSAYDMGAGVGDCTLRLQELGWTIKALEYSADARALADPALECLPFDLTESSDEQLPRVGADCVVCTETAEHIEAEFADRVVQNVARRAREVIIFSAAQPGNIWEGHVNLQAPSYWHERFDKLGWRVSWAETRYLWKLMRERYAQHWGAADNFYVLRKREPKMVVVSTCFASPVEAKHKLSVAEQTIKVEHIFIDAAKQDPPRSHSENLFRAVLPLHPDSVVVQLDGDDWLATPEALEKVMKLYEDPEVWLTYGSFLLSVGTSVSTTNAPYAPDEDVRTSRWRASHLKTFRAGLFQRIDPEDLKGQDGQFTSYSVDRATMYPMMEMAGWDRTRWVRDFLCVYNWDNTVEKNSLERTALGQKATEFFEKKLRYPRLVSYKQEGPAEPELPFVPNVGLGFAHEGWRPEVHGWSSDILPYYERLARELPDGSVVVEVGAYKGRSILFLAEQLRSAGKHRCTLFAVDPWADPMDKKAFDRNLKKMAGSSLVTPLQMTSMQAAGYLEGKGVECDLVFIDGLHDYESVKQDICAWRRLVKPGGTLAGHDYWNWGQHEGVGRAVDEAFPGVVTCSSVWHTHLGGERLLLPRSELVSVVVPCHQQSQYLLEALGSITEQTYRCLEVIGVTGDERSEDVFDRAAGSLKLPTKHVKGAVHRRAHAVNAGVTVSSGKYIVVLDADDLLAPDAIEKLVSATPLREDLVITTMNMRKFGGANHVHTTGPYFPNNMLSGCDLLTSSLFSRELWERAGKFEQSLFGFEDWAFWIACGRLFPVVSKVNAPLLRYRVHASQGSNMCERNRSVLEAMVRIINYQSFGTPRSDDVMTIARSSDEARGMIRALATAFPEDRFARQFGGLVSDQVAQAIGLSL